MRLLILGCCLFIAACGDDGTAPSPAQLTTETPPMAAEEGAIPSAEGFISALVDGERRSFSYLPPAQNVVRQGRTLVIAQTALDDRHGIVLSLSGIDVRHEQLPQSFQRGGIREYPNLGLPTIPEPSIEYRALDGTIYAYTFGEGLECQSFEERTLKCTFEALVRDPVSGGTVQLSEGQVEAQLRVGGAH